MRPSPLLSSLTLGFLLLVPPVYAVNYTGEAILDWNTLKFSGIPIMITDKSQTQSMGYTAHARGSGNNCTELDPNTMTLSVHGPQRP